MWVKLIEPDDKFVLNTSFLSIHQGFHTRSPLPTPYATANLVSLDGINSQQFIERTVYGKSESMSPSDVSYYASSHLTQCIGSSTPVLNTERSTPEGGHWGHTLSATSGVSNNRHENYFEWNKDAKNSYKCIEVSSNAIICRKLMREGTYGRIYAGNLSSKICNNNRLNRNDNEGEIPVLIKTVTGRVAQKM